MPSMDNTEAVIRTRLSYPWGLRSEILVVAQSATLTSLIGTELFFPYVESK